MPRRILITGATGAIGSALAAAYARPGCILFLHGRQVSTLEAIARRCRTQGAEVETAAFDVRDGARLDVWLAGLGALDLAVVNAGLNTHIGPRGEAEPWAEVEALIEVNLKAAMRIVHGVLPAMRARGSGQLVMMSSLAGYFGLPVTPTYSATKAGLKAYGEALRGWLAPEGIRVSVIMPGYVRSPMCDDMPGPKPFLWTPERAARVIQKGLACDKARITFPFPLNWGSWWLAVLPPAWSLRILRWLGYGR